MGVVMRRLVPLIVGLVVGSALLTVGSFVAAPPALSAPAPSDTYGLVDSATGIWRLYERERQVAQFYFGNPGDSPFMGDWDCDGFDTPGLYRQSDGYVYLRNSNTVGVADTAFFFGNPGDVPVAGDFNSNGCDTVSIYRPSEQRFYIINELGTNDGGLGAAEYSFVFGNPGDKPFVGDFNGNGQDTIGLHRESSGLVYFRNTNTQGIADNQFIYGDPGDRFMAGDWTGDGIDSPGLFRPVDSTMYLRHENSQGNADQAWTVGQGAWLPVAGRFGIPPADIPVGGQVTGEQLWALVPGNDLAADRINLVFAPSGWDDYQAFVTTASQSLSWTGDAYLIASDQSITDDPALAESAQMGLFSIEPWRSSRDRFNVWYTDLAPGFPAEWLNNPNHPFKHIPDVSIMTLALDAHLSNPDLTSVAGIDNVFVGPGTPVRPASGDPFANSLAVIRSDAQASGLSEIPHELGHALFSLADEYVGDRLGYDGRPNLSSWPSCAQDVSEATAWWGDLIGQIDPMVDTWADEMNQAGFPIDKTFLEGQVKVENVPGGCYAVATSARATKDSLMMSNMPVLGSVNRRWAQQIVDLWPGQPRP
jgi:hypothetical protein